MKKFVAVVLVVMMMAGIVFADDTMSKRVYSMEIANTLGIPKQSVVPTTSIRPKVDKLIGYSVFAIDNTLPSECFVAIFDQTGTATWGECLAESEAGTLKYINELWPFGKWIEDGVVVTQGANTKVVVFFVKE